MAILPVSGVRVSNNNTKITSFKGLNVGENDGMPKPRKANKLASVPVALLIAMSPAMMNGQEQVKAIPINNENLTELLAYAAPSEVAEPEPQVRAASTSAPFGFKMLANKKIFKTMNATVKGAPATLILAGEKTIGGKTNTNNVQYIYYIPKNNDYPKNTSDLPEAKNIIFHDIGQGEFCGLEMEIPIYNEGKTVGYLYRELKIDDDTANTLADFISGDMSYKNWTFPIFTLKTTNSPELMKVRSIKL